MDQSLVELGKLLSRLRDCVNAVNEMVKKPIVKDSDEIRLRNTIVFIERDIVKLANKLTIELCKREVRAVEAQEAKYDSSRKRRAS